MIYLQTIPTSVTSYNHNYNKIRGKDIGHQVHELFLSKTFCNHYRVVFCHKEDPFCNQTLVPIGQIVIEHLSLLDSLLLDSLLLDTFFLLESSNSLLDTLFSLQFAIGQFVTEHFVHIGQLLLDTLFLLDILLMETLFLIRQLIGLLVTIGHFYFIEHLFLLDSSLLDTLFLLDSLLLSTCSYWTVCY